MPRHLLASLLAISFSTSTACALTQQAPPAVRPDTPPVILPAPAPEAHPEPPPFAPLPIPPEMLIRESAVLDAPGPTASPSFGSIIGWAGPRVVVTGPDRPRTQGFTGQIATFERTVEGWKPLVEMAGIPTGQPGDLLLQRITASEDWVLSNADRFGQVGAAAVIAFARDPASASGWTLRQRIRPPQGIQAPNFGSVMATDGVYAAFSVIDTVVRGPTQRTPTLNPNVCLYRVGATGWVPAGTVQRDTESDAIWFGASLALDSGTLAVGSPRAIPPSPKQPAQESGTAAVCIFRFVDGQWKKEAELLPPGDCDWPTFGTVMAMHGDLCVVRANRLDLGEARVFVYRRTGSSWNLEAELKPEAPVQKGNAWGLALSVGDGFVVVGDPSAGVGAQSSGAVCIYGVKDGAWRLRWLLTPSVPTSRNRFGGALQTRGHQVLVGRNRNENDGIEPGGALLFDVPGN